MSPYERYQQDPQFRDLVDMIELMIGEKQFTPDDLRNAIIQALVHIHRKNPTIDNLRPVQRELELNRDCPINPTQHQPKNFPNLDNELK